MNDSQSIEKAKSFFLSGLEKLNKNNFIGAEIDFEFSLSLAPNRLSTLINLSIVLIKLNKFENAEKLINKGLLHHPKNKELLLGLVDIYKKLIQHKPDYAEAHSNLGNSYKELKMYEEALASYSDALRLNPNLAEVYSNRGIVFNELKKYPEALKDYDKAIAIKPDYAVVYSNRGIVFNELKKYQEALKDYDKAIAIKPDYEEVFLNKGDTLQSLNRFEDALDSYDRAIEIKTDYVEAYWNKSLILLLAGDFVNGWNLYEYRWKLEILGSRIRTFSQPLWLGNENIQNKTILLHAEQGLGDTIQFCRYAKLVKELGARVLLEVPKSLLNLLNGLEGVDEFIESGKEIPAFDYHCPLLSLPLAFNTNLSNIASHRAYLKCDPNKVKHWQNKLGDKKKLRIGVVWSSVSSFKGDKNRSMRLKEFIQCIPLEKYQVVCLQKDIKVEDKDYFQLLSGQIYSYGTDLKDFADTAALAKCVDLVVSTCTSVPHMTAALGVPTWILLSSLPDWRWLLEREDSPWYPSIKIYRQPSLGDWQSVLRRVRKDLIEYSKNYNVS